MRFLWERWKFWFHIWTANLNVQALIISNLNVQNDSLVMHTSEQQLDERTEHKTSDRKLIKHLILVPRRPVTFYPCSRCHSIQVITVPQEEPNQLTCSLTMHAQLSDGPSESTTQAAEQYKFDRLYCFPCTCPDSDAKSTTHESNW